VFYTYYTGGVRVFDVRNPARPVEIAYYHPPPVPRTVHRPIAPRLAGDYQGPTWDSATSDIRYVAGRNELWFVSIGRGFQVIKLRTPEAAAGSPPAESASTDERRGSEGRDGDGDVASTGGAASAGAAAGDGTDNRGLPDTGLALALLVLLGASAITAGIGLRARTRRR
ncbi:MAG: hypothetical protein ACRDL0_00270, partial [Thermoleophilaceae bacterium]